MWLWLAIPIVAYLLYRVFQFATADADNALCSKRLKAGYLHEKVVWITGASSGSKCTFLYFCLRPSVNVYNDTVDVQISQAPEVSLMFMSPNCCAVQNHCAKVKTVLHVNMLRIDRLARLGRWAAVVKALLRGEALGISNYAYLAHIASHTCCRMGTRCVVILIAFS